MLFSEPKIPQLSSARRRIRFQTRFSALQRAENSSIKIIRCYEVIDTQRFQCSSASRKFLNTDTMRAHSELPPFQCSSASRKFLNDDALLAALTALQRFSALQRAENSSIDIDRNRTCGAACFSALQRAENSSMWYAVGTTVIYLQFQCSSASRKFLNGRPRLARRRERSVSVLFSEPKIPQFSAQADGWCATDDVSVLFSEPKIPQCCCLI